MDSQPSRCADAVILVPGLMGSRLVDGHGALVWGLSPGLLARQLLHHDLLERLRVTPDDDFRPHGLLRAPALIPGLGGLDPYTPLTRALRNDILQDPAGLLEFAYDWRLSIENAARELAKVAAIHLDAWRVHPRGNPHARLRLVCHSLGGLVAQYFTEVLGGRAITHQTITLGTPHYGSLRALAALANGRIAPLGFLANQVRALSRTMPSMYELAPRYACVITTPGSPLRQLTASDMDAVGADDELVHAAANAHSSLRGAATTGKTPCPIRAQVGITQPTWQSVAVTGGEATMHEDIEGEDRGGDGTVYRDAAAPIGVRPDYIPQRHGRLASALEAIVYVHHVLTERPLGPPMAATDGIGIDIPATIAVGDRLEIRIASDPDRRVLCRAVDQETGRQVGAAMAGFDPARNLVTAHLTIPRPGLYAIHAKSGGYSATGELILAHEPRAP